MKTAIENTGQNRGLKKDQYKDQPNIQSNAQKKEQKNNGRERPSVIKNLIGKEITITLRNGTSIKGRLETVVQYELVITTPRNPIIVMKHAIDYIEPVGEK